MNHEQIVENLSKQIRDLKGPFSLKYRGHSNTTRTKSYKQNIPKLDFSPLNRVLEIDLDKKIALVEPRVTMEKLLMTVLPYGLMPPVVPEFKGITVGGAIMGGAAESSSHRYGIFNDTCLSFDILSGEGSLIHASPFENPDIFYGIAGSYGSLGALVRAEIQLIPAQKYVHLTYRTFSDTKKAFAAMQNIVSDFVDGICYGPHHTVIIEGNLQNTFGKKESGSQWYYKKAQNLYEESMPLSDYLFRYDRGAFWMGAYLFHPAFLARFIKEGLLPFPKEGPFSKVELAKFHNILKFNHITKFLPIKSQMLWSLLHKAEKWVQERFIIQDFCLPSSLAHGFLDENPGVFPLWLCPIKGTTKPQIFAPHLTKKEENFINIGMYGLPCISKPVSELTRDLEEFVHLQHGRKVLYSHSYYTPSEFWQIYSQVSYNKLRKKTKADGIWQDITEKVLSI